MAIINITSEHNKPKEITLTIAQRVDSLHANIVRELEFSSNFIWNNPDATPQEIFTELGTEGYKLFELSSALVQVANQANPSSPITLNIPYEYVINPDGSVTVGDPIVPEEPQGE